VFTGIIEGIGKVESLRVGSAGHGTRRLTVKTTLDVGTLPLGASIAVNGACLTIVARRAGRPAMFQADLGQETLACTTLGALVPGGQVHLERALRLGDSLGGHLVSGHVDGTGQVESARTQGGTLALRVVTPKELSPYFFTKGSVAIDGVSLTINEVDSAALEVLLIPHTLEVTLLGKLRAGDHVNLEADMIAKQIARFVERTHGR
jgi:riboflavin synthase